MENEKWSEIKYFTKEENWGNAEKIDTELIFALDALREFVGHPIRIHCGYEERGGTSLHNFGKAVDCSCAAINVVDFFLAASRFSFFSGIGIYPFWNSPGLHLDVRKDNKFRSLWASTVKNKYQNLTSELLKSVLNWKY